MRKAIEGVEVVAKVEIGPGRVELVVETGDGLVPIDLRGDDSIELFADFDYPALNDGSFMVGSSNIEALDQEDRQNHNQRKAGHSHGDDRAEQSGPPPIMGLVYRTAQAELPRSAPE